MEQKLQRVKGLLPGRLARQAAKLYKRSRAKVISARYGNPAGTVRVIALVGVYGKTTTARLLAELLEEAGRKVLVGTQTGQGLHISLEQLQQELKNARKENSEFFILEITPELVASGGLEGIAIDTVVVTSKTAETNAILGQNVNYIVIPDDHTTAALALAEHQIISFGETDDAEAKVNEVTLYRKGTEVKMTIDHHTELIIATHLVGKANALNLAAAVATAYVLGVALDTVEEGAARLEKVAGNYEYVPTTEPYTLVVDSAMQERSVQLVAESAKKLAKRRVIVALESDGISEEVIKDLKKRVDRLITVGKQEVALPGVESVDSVEEASLIATRAAKKDDTVLLLGKNFVRSYSRDKKEVV